MAGHEGPGIFGLHPNADLTFRSLQVQAAIQLILETRPADFAAISGTSKEEIVDKLCEDLLAKVWAAPAALKQVQRSPSSAQTTALQPRQLH